MKLFERQSRLARLGETVRDTLDTGGSMPGSGGNPIAALPHKDKALKAGLIAGGLAGLTALSSGISSLRRRQEEAGGVS